MRDGKLKERSQNLRKNATREENHLWYDFLKNYPVQIRRQVPIDRFIADFYCAQAKLIIELDGNHHFTEAGTIYDKERTEYLKKYRIKVIRFSNFEVKTNFEYICKIIDFEIKKRIENLNKEEI